MHRDNGNNLRCADGYRKYKHLFLQESRKYDIDYSTYFLRYVLLSCVSLLHIKSRHISYVAEFMGFEIHFIGCEMHFAIAILVAINKTFPLEIKSEFQPNNI